MKEPLVRIVDDNEASRHSLCLLVETVGLTAESYSSPADFLKAFDPDRPGCIVLDVRLPGMSGIELIDCIRKKQSQIPIIVVTAYADVPTAVRALKNSAIDFFEKPFSNQAMLDSIQHCVNNDITRRREQQELTLVHTRIACLSKRERQILDLIVDGHSSRLIAEELCISPRTVENHRAHINKKMGVSSFAELVSMAQRARATSTAG